MKIKGKGKVTVVHGLYRKATATKYGFLFITTGADPRFFSSYDSEFKVRDQDEE